MGQSTEYVFFFWNCNAKSITLQMGYVEIKGYPQLRVLGNKTFSSNYGLERWSVSVCLPHLGLDTAYRRGKTRWKQKHRSWLVLWNKLERCTQEVYRNGFNIFAYGWIGFSCPLQGHVTFCYKCRKFRFEYTQLMPFHARSISISHSHVTNKQIENWLHNCDGHVASNIQQFYSNDCKNR